MRDARPIPDPSEDRADRVLSREKRRNNPTYNDGQSVFDEPDILPGRAGEVVEQDWSCSHCGYNLRGLTLERRCPECGSRELYRPPPPGASSYQTWLMRQQDLTSPRVGWTIAVLAAVLGGPLAVVAALTQTSPGGFMGTSMPMLAIVFAPFVEETLKIAAASYVVEVRPYLFKRVEQIQLATVGSAACFAAIENLIYLNVYIASPTAAQVMWRWTVCVALHVGCTLLASRGLVLVWRRATEEHRLPRIGDVMPALGAAIVVHACYNAAALGWAWR